MKADYLILKTTWLNNIMLTIFHTIYKLYSLGRASLASKSLKTPYLDQKIRRMLVIFLHALLQHILFKLIPTEKYTENCPASQSYSYQLQSCQHTCLSLASERQSCSVDFVPVDGCACPEGLYHDENELCVPMEKCPCYHKGVKIHPGKSVTIRDEHW